MTTPARIAVVGGGAVGTVLADAASRAGHDVTLCVRTITGPPVLRTTSGDETVLDCRITASPSSVTPHDWVLVATKAHDSVGAGPWLERLADRRTVVVVCQNGIGHVGRVAPSAPFSTVVPAIVGIIAERLGPGSVLHVAGRRLTVPEGEPGRALGALFPGGELEIRGEQDFERAVWLKFLGNLAAAPVTTLTSRRMDVLREPEVRDVLRSLIGEAVAVGRAVGVALEDADVEATLGLLQGLDPAATTSMQADRAAGRPLEVEELTGALVRLADERGIPTPVNRTVLALLRSVRPSKE